MRPHADPAVTDVVFVIHGIRDWGHWTQKIARHVQREGSRSGRRFATETSSYGYFPMLPFLLPGRRRAKVHWLMDQYVEDRALYPNAEFSCVGHSNGTYLLARALEDYPAVSFKHIVFAGSVVRSAYPWSSLIQRGQAAAVLNYVATSDWVVAIFPKLFQVFHWQDLGGAGHDGFLNPEPPERIRQVRYIRGRHAAALDEHNWDQIASFVVHGTMPSPPSPLPSRQHWFVALLGNAPYLAWLFILGALCVGFYFVLYWSPGEGQSLATILGQPVIALRLAAFAAYLWLIKTILTRL